MRRNPQIPDGVLAAMEQAGKLQCVISSNIYELSQRAGCKNVMDLHGSIYHNYCLRCGRNILWNILSM